MDVEGVGDEGGERQDRSRLKSPNPSKIVPRIAFSPAGKRIVLSSLSSTSACTATIVSFTVSRPKESGLRPHRYSARKQYAKISGNPLHVL